MSSVRKRLGAATAAVACLAAAGCTTSGAEDPAPSPSASTSHSAPAGGAEVSIDFAVYGNDEQLESYTDLANAFMKNNPNVTVSVARAPDADAAMNNLDTRSKQGDPPDVFLMEHRDLPRLMAEDMIQPVHQLLEDRQLNFGDGFQRDGLEAFSAETALQCMPHDVSPLVVYYNEKLLDLSTLVDDPEDPETLEDAPNAEDGWTWEQFSRAAQKMSRGGTKGLYIEPSVEQLAPFIWSGGGELVDDPLEPTTLTFGDGDTQAALEEVLTLARDPQLTPTRAEIEKTGAVEQFRNGRIGMILGTRELTPELRRSQNLAFEVMPLPALGRYRTTTPMSGYCISAKSDQAEVAADFLAFAVSREGATITTTGGYVVPSNLQVAHSPAFSQPSQRPHNSFVFNEGVRRAERMPFVPQWQEVVDETRPFLETMFYAPVIDLESLLDQIDTASQPLLAPAEAPEPEEE